MPEVPKEIVPEEEVSVPIPEEPEAPIVEGTRLLYKSWKDDNRLYHLTLVVDESFVFICCLSYVVKLLMVDMLQLNSYSILFEIQSKIKYCVF